MARPLPIHDLVADSYVSHAVDLMRYEAGVRKRVLAQLLLLQDDLEKQIRLMDQVPGMPEPARRRKAEALISQTRQTISTAMDAAGGELDSEMVDLAKVESRAVVASGNAAFGGSVLTTTLTRKTLATVVGNVLIEGAPSRDWWAEQSRRTRMRFASQVRLGILGGETNADIVRRVRGRSTGVRRVVKTKAGKTRVLHEFRGGVMDATTREAEALVRTSVQTAANQVADEVYRENGNVLRGRQALATLDKRTSEICMARAGSAWDFDGKALPESPRQESFPGPPPWHWNCRTILIPLTKPWEQIVEESSGKKIKKLKRRVPVKTRAAMGGPVASDLNFEGWLKTKPKAFQIEKLGPEKWQLWHDGKITLPQLIDQTGRPLTLVELREKAKR